MRRLPGRGEERQVISAQIIDGCGCRVVVFEAGVVATGENFCPATRRFPWRGDERETYDSRLKTISLLFQRFVHDQTVSITITALR
jgi:hypothetical protein